MGILLSCEPDIILLSPARRLYRRMGPGIESGQRTRRTWRSGLIALTTHPRRPINPWLNRRLRHKNGAILMVMLSEELFRYLGPDFRVRSLDLGARVSTRTKKDVSPKEEHQYHRSRDAQTCFPEPIRPPMLSCTADETRIWLRSRRELSLLIAWTWEHWNDRDGVHTRRNLGLAWRRAASLRVHETHPRPERAPLLPRLAT